MNREINQFNLSSGLLNKYKNLIFYNSHWHKIEVENVEGLDRDAVLRTMMRFCGPFDFIPVRYEASKNTASFLLKNCGNSIEKLCSQNLIVINPFNSDKPFKITIKLCHSHTNDLKINIQINVVSVLNKRFNAETGILNLENFARDSELEEYCTLAQPKLCFYILHLTKSINFKVLKLSNNDIESLKPMEALEGFKNNITVDLRNNSIKDIEELDNMQHLNITELWLDGNPVCDSFNEITYGKAIRERLEKVERLDGVNIQLKGFLPFRRNFLCNLSGHDLVDQFLEHYFTLYDARNRSVLVDLYHKDAMFSMNSMYLIAQSTSQAAKLAPYKKYSRNLKQISDFSKTSHTLFKGPYAILKVLNALPTSEHDPFSFTVDLVMYTEQAAMLVVCGVYRECSESLLETDRLLSFTRTFVLQAGTNGEYSIINEMLHVTNATTGQATRSFKQVRLPKPQFIYIPQPQNEREKTDMADALKIITGLKAEWAHKCLAECNYEMKAAIALFIDLFKVDKIPKSAFLSNEDVRHENRPQHQRKVDTPNLLNPYSSNMDFTESQRMPSAKTTPLVDNMRYNANRSIESRAFDPYATPHVERVRSTSVSSSISASVSPSVTATSVPNKQSIHSALTEIQLQPMIVQKNQPTPVTKTLPEKKTQGTAQSSSAKPVAVAPPPKQNPPPQKKVSTNTVNKAPPRPLSPNDLWDEFSKSNNSRAFPGPFRGRSGPPRKTGTGRLPPPQQFEILEVPKSRLKGIVLMDDGETTIKFKVKYAKHAFRNIHRPCSLQTVDKKKIVMTKKEAINLGVLRKRRYPASLYQ